MLLMLTTTLSKGLSFGDTFTPDRWDLRQLGFVIAIIKVNSMLGYNYFWCTTTYHPMLDKATFTREIASALIYCSYEDHDEYEVVGNCSQQKQVIWHLRQEAVFSLKELKTNEDPSHCLCNLDWHHGKWNCHEFPNVTSKYTCCQCRAKCGREYRNFCSCDWNLILCHVMIVNTIDDCEIGALWLDFFMNKAHFFLCDKWILMCTQWFWDKLGMFPIN